MLRLKKVVVIGAVALLAAGAVALWVFRNEIAHHFAMVRGERMVDKGIVTVSDLTGHMTISAESFDQITSFPEWSMVPRDFVVFRNVPLQIDGMMCLWGANNAKQGFVMPEEALDVGIKGKFAALYIYHATFYGSPPGTPVYDVVFRYDDGFSVTNQICYGNDVFDWFSGGKTPSNPRSKVAWHGEYNSGSRKQPLSFYLTAINNPYPTITVTSVDLYSCKSGSAACIGAMTAGPAGLMR